MKHTLLALMFLFVAVAPALAADTPDSLEKIRGQQSALAADLDAGKTDGLTPRQVNSIRRAQKEVLAVTDGKQSIDDLSIDEKVKLENALERINAEVKGGGRVASDAQEVCWRERMSGSQMKVTRCGTEAERREAREGARAYLDKPRVCVPPGCGGQ